MNVLDDIYFVPVCSPENCVQQSEANKIFIFESLGGCTFEHLFKSLLHIFRSAMINLTTKYFLYTVFHIQFAISDENAIFKTTVCLLQYQRPLIWHRKSFEKEERGFARS